MASFIEFKGKEESTVTEVPGFLLPDFGTHVLGALTGNQNLSMKIHHDQGQSLKLEITSGGIPDSQSIPRPSPLEKTRFMLVRWNIPISINEAHLKECFEPSEYGMRLVKSVKLFRGRPAALVEFIDESAVGNVLSRATIIYRNIEFHFTPFKPLLAPNEKISEVNIQGSCLLHVGDFTEFVLEKQLEHLVPPPCGIEPTAIMQVGSRVLRGRDWIYGNQDGEGLGTVTHFFFIPFGAPYTHNVSVQWDNGNWYSYRMSGGFYELKLAPTAQ